ncbi:MAG: copper chaperone CopZ [Bacilli bacterium]|nr:copper chaperone CopZ [Bacilli bacterium]
MENILLQVDGMSCEHCVSSITKALTSLNGVEKVEVQLENKTVEVQFAASKISIDQIKEAIEDLGYDIA